MKRKIRVDVDKSTWPTGGQGPAFPTGFVDGETSHDMSIPEMLLMIGSLTTPTSSTGLSLSEFWAWVRYLAAVSSQPALSLTKSFSDLDAHQKTILSDDFGMGVPMLWLRQKLSLDKIVDGRYFMQRIASSLGATQRRAAKRGPNKTPDFVARDGAGNWHVIECKGTQSGLDYGRRQLGEKGPPASGGVAQKLAIEFAPGYAGQRLVCGLSIDVEGGGGSVLRIVDPKPDEPLSLREDQMDLAEDAANRGVMAKALRMAGFEVSAESVASPFGIRPDEKPSIPKQKQAARKKFTDERDTRSRQELQSNLTTTHVFDQNFRGREVAVELPRAVFVDTDVVRRVVIKQGVNRDVLSELEQKPTFQELADTERVPWVRFMGKIIIESDKRSASMSIGNLYRSEIYLMP